MSNFKVGDYVIPKPNNIYRYLEVKIYKIKGIWKEYLEFEDEDNLLFHSDVFNISHIQKFNEALEEILE